MWGQFSWPEFVQILPNYLVVGMTALLIYMTVFQIKAARGDANRRAAFDYFIRETNNDEFRELREKVFRVVNSNKNSGDMLKQLPNDNPDMVAVRKYLNRQEAFAAGVLNGGLCEEYSKNLIGSRFVQDWKFFEPYVCEARSISGNDNTYGYFCELARKWSKEGVS
ncbi:hypothetical protein GCM10007854_27440 [Algimonas porphyrae]|uniref:DUF4760 domain-containing protein n=2 Tax=Algimonas porphyrae TaxID=1128113 RepID=A0ABQ5V4A1_9PROT|nr:hypothetical protein GCM10007854_27440 [Algimonas porphyrae]